MRERVQGMAEYMSQNDGFIYHIYSLILMMSEDGGAVPRRESIAWLVRVHVDWTCSVIQWQPVPNLGNLPLTWWAGGMTMSIDRLPWHGYSLSFVVWDIWGIKTPGSLFYHTITFLSRNQGCLAHSVTEQCLGLDSVNTRVKCNLPIWWSYYIILILINNRLCP